MKANDAKKIKLEAEQARADQKRYLLEQENQRKKLEQENIEELNKNILLLETDLLYFKKLIAEALTESKDYIVFNSSFLASLYQHVQKANKLGGQLKKKHIDLPAVLGPYKSDKGYGIFNPKKITNKPAQDLSQVRLEISSAIEVDYNQSLLKVVREALVKYDPADYPTIDYIDEKIIQDIQKRVIIGQSLNDEELTFVVAILKGNFRKYHSSHKLQRLYDILNFEKIVEQKFRYVKIRQSRSFITVGVDDLVLCWGSNVCWTELFEKSPYKQEPLTNASFARENPASVDVLANVNLLNWAASLGNGGFYEECFSFISRCAKEGFDSCIVKVTENSLMLSQGGKRKGHAFVDSIPLSKDVVIYDYWKDFFGLLDYKTEVIKTPSTFKISWN